jgi:hypothetical protein
MRLLLVVLAVVGLSTAAHAQKKEKKQSLHDSMSGQGYGLAGCGLGSIVFGPQPGMIQVVAATLNGTAGSQTFGITTGTSNCDMPEAAMAAASFIEVNKEVVSKEAARGEGESIDNLASIFQCSDYNLFRTRVKENYGKVFGPEINSYDSSRAIIQTIKSDASLTKACGQLS